MKTPLTPDLEADLFFHLLGAIEVFNKKHSLSLTTGEVASLSEKFPEFVELFFKRLRKRK